MAGLLSDGQIRGTRRAIKLVYNTFAVTDVIFQERIPLPSQGYRGETLNTETRLKAIFRNERQEDASEEGGGADAQGEASLLFLVEDLQQRGLADSAGNTKFDEASHVFIVQGKTWYVVRSITRANLDAVPILSRVYLTQRTDIPDTSTVT